MEDQHASIKAIAISLQTLSIHIGDIKTTFEHERNNIDDNSRARFEESIQSLERNMQGIQEHLQKLVESHQIISRGVAQIKKALVD